MLPGLALSLAALAPHHVPLADLHVDVAAANCGAATGTAAQPFCSIAEAVAAAAPGDTVLVAPGTYLEHVTIGIDLDLIGTAGRELTIVDGGGAGGSVITVLHPAHVLVDGLTITRGRAPIGGGVRVTGDLVLRNSTVTQNLATAYVPLAAGGGLAVDGSSASLELERCTVSDNRTNNTEYGIGGSHGAGLWARDASVVVRDSTIIGNRATDGSGSSAGSTTAGGGVHVRGSTLTISNSTIADNIGGALGGGVYGRSSTISVSNSTSSGNRSSLGPALYARQSTLPTELTHVTFTRNVNLVYPASAVRVDSLTVRDSVIAGNNASTSIPEEYTDLQGAVQSLGHNVIGSPVQGAFVPGIGDQVGTASAFIDPLLGPLQDNGGPTPTHLPLPGSPLIDAANPAVSSPFDQRGLTRPQGSAPDIGAVEREDHASLCNGAGGDGMGCTNCPCANDAPAGTVGGCLNEAGSSTRLDARGDASLAQPAGATIDLRFALSDAPPGVLCVLTSGDALAPTNPAAPCFGLGSGVASVEFDGLRCATTNLRRHGARFSDASGATPAPWGGEGAPAAGLAHAFGGFAAGATRYFQAVHRESASVLCMRGLNTSQAIEIAFTP